MLKHKLSKDQKRDLKQLGDSLPVQYYEINAHRQMRGADIMKNPRIDKSGFGRIIPGAKYVVTSKVSNPVNHYRRILSAYEQGGMDAVEVYCVAVNDKAMKEAKESTSKTNGNTNTV